MEKKPRQSSIQRSIPQKKPLGIVHTDLVGPTRNKGLKGEKYFMILDDDYTWMTTICFLNKKLEVSNTSRYTKSWLKLRHSLKSSV